MANSNKMRIVYGDGTIGLHTKKFQYIFSYERGSIESIKVKGKEWLYRPFYPTYWRASTNNDQGNGFAYNSAQWLGADVFPKCTNIDLTVDDHHFDRLPIAPLNNKYSEHESARVVKIVFTYQTATVPSTKTVVSYTVKASGTIRVKAYFYGVKGLPQLPIFGLRMIMPTAATSYTYRGLSNETYPDRMAGAVKGKFKVKGMPLTHYMTPQDMGMHMATEKLKVTRETTLNNADLDNDKFSLRFVKDHDDFNFSLLPYTAEEIESATHIEELPLERRAVLIIAGAVRGVGGIDSWGAPVEKKYQLPADNDYQFSFKIKP